MRKRIAGAAVISLLFVVGVASAASVDGINIHWTSSGSGAQTVILVHGWTCDETSWQGQAPSVRSIA